MAEHEQEFVEYIVKSIVENPDKVQVERSLDQKGVFLELTVDPDDVGKVIGKKGATINALRALLRVLGAKHDARYSLKVVEQDSGHERSHSHGDDTQTTEIESPIQDEADSIASKAREGLEDLDDLDV